MSISTVTSEALQLKLRQLLPSQQGFGTDLSASDTIIPVIDLTAAAEGADIPAYLQNALAFGSQTSVRAANGSVVLANTPGFYKINYDLHASADSSSTDVSSIELTDGSTTKVIAVAEAILTNNNSFANVFGEIFVFLDTGESINAVSSSVKGTAAATARQVADTNGVAINPSGFTPQ